MCSRLLWAGILPALLHACVDPADPAARLHPVPLLERVEPSLLIVGTADRSLMLGGYQFVEGARVLWNGDERPTTFVGPRELVVVLEPADVAAVGAATVVVENPEPGGGPSIVRDVLVGHPAPAVDSVRPGASVALPAEGVELQIYGHSFAVGPEGATALWQGVIPLASEAQDPARITAHVPEHLLRRGSVFSITVRNPAPGGGISAALPFRLDNPVPLITAVSPDSVTLEQSTALSILGEGFVPGVEVWYGGTRLEIVAVSATALSVSIPGSLNQRVSVPVYVVNPEPAGGASNVFDVPVRELPPRLFSLSKRSVLVGSESLTIELRGDQFAPDAAVVWNGEARTTRHLTSARLEVDLPASDFGTVGMAALRVINPRGGGESQSRPFATVPEGRVLYSITHDSIRISNLDGSDAVTYPPLNAQEIDAPTVGTATVFGELTCTGQCLRRLRFGGPGPPYESVVQTDPLRYYEYYPSFTANGAWVYFLTTICLSTCGFSNPADYGGLWRVRPDGTGEELVTPEPTVDPAPSSGGEEVAFTQGTILHVLDVATSDVRSLGVRAANPEWSPDDQWIAYRDELEDLRLIRPDGSGDRLVTSSVDMKGRVGWSADGRYVVAGGDYRPNGELPEAAVAIDAQTGEVIWLLGLSYARNMVWYGGP